MLGRSVVGGFGGLGRSVLGGFGGLGRSVLEGFGRLGRFLIIYMVFIGIPAPLPITFAEVVLSSWNDFSFEKIAFRVDESSIFIINHLRPASEGQNHFQCSGTKQLW